MVATLRGTHAETTQHVGLRVDMDALPLDETDTPHHLPARAGFASTWPGAMHACGHDGHIGMALELAERLAASPPPGTVTLFVQPAEDGGRGAQAMAATGLADPVDLFVAVHLGLALPTGTCRPAVNGLLANSKLRATFHGQPAHAALAPQERRNALLGAAAATLALQGLTRVAGHQTHVAIGAIHGGATSNIVPETAQLLAETRADDGDINTDLETRARAMLTGAAHMHDLQVDIDLIGAAPTARADADAIRAITAAASTAGLHPTDPTTESGMPSDDATALMQRVQTQGGLASYTAIGADLSGGRHTSEFDFDKTALAAGVDLLESLTHHHR